ncbi:MAG: hypothetical protein IJD59_07355 [Clostridia bacterium]|nr:hypothetical protein [Clostridia bacterium]
MSIQLRLPDVKGTDREQLRQIRSYLYQLVPQLQWALDQALPDGESIASEPPVGGGESLSAASFRGTASAYARSAAWTELGLSDEVSSPARTLGRGGAGCRYRVYDGRIFVAFSCGVPAETPVTVNAEPLPSDCRPTAPVYALCPALCADGSMEIAFAEIDAEGFVRILSAGGREIAAVDGEASFFVLL